jgi:predicted TIM-barrel fold metal-dependent hydrolase
MIIDSHAHIYPAKIAMKAADSIGKFYGIDMDMDGTLNTLLAKGSAAGIDRFLVHSVATTPKQIDSINNYIHDKTVQYGDKLIGFATLHPDSKELPRQVDDILEMGLRGIKIHPDFQKFDVDSKEAYKMYELIEGRLPILMHIGDYRTQYSKPQKLCNVLRDFPDLDVIAAHFGGWSEWDLGEKYLAGKRLWVDTSSSTYKLSAQRVKELIDAFGADNVLFGTDYPMWDPASELERMSKVDLSDTDREKIYHINLEKLLAKYE